MSGRLRYVVLAVLLLVQALAVGLVVVITGASTRELLVDEMRQTLDLAAQSLSTRTVDHLGPAETAAAFDAQLLQDGVVPLDDDDVLLGFLDAQVRSADAQAGSASAITGAYVGRPDGSFVLVSRDGAAIDGGTRAKTITVGPQGRVSSTVQRDGAGSVRSDDVDPTDTFDPRERPWYAAASSTDGVAWTDPYVFFASGEPGVTASHAVRGPDGAIEAVVGVDLSLRDLSDFVAGITVSPASEAALVDLTGTMVATGELDQVVIRDPDGTLRRASVGELTDPVLTGAVDAVAQAAGTDGDGALEVQPEPGQVQVLPFEVDGRSWQVAVTLLPGRQQWLAAVMAPEDEFVNEVVDAQRRNALIAVGIGLAVVALAVPGVTWLSRRLDRAHERAATDELTDLPNRRRFDELLDQHLASRRRPLCVAMIDVDLFKQVNDTHGHGVGDDVLRAIAGRLRASVRDQDVVARVGGDEFAALLVDTPIELAAEVLERARLEVAGTPVATGKGPVPATVTIGVAPVADGDDAAAVRERADAALYLAKDAGRDRVATPGGVSSPSVRG